jgi:MerR family transcriptional regulator, mercuric resistance operon regulatory protein
MVAMAITTARPVPWTIGQLSRKSGVNIETIRYFERIGLLLKAARAPNGRRQYGGEHFRRLHFIRRARAMGFSQAEVKRLIGLSDGRPSACDAAKLIADEALSVVRQKIEELSRMERVLASAARQCARGTSPNCPLIDSLFPSGTLQQSAEG